VRASIQQHHVAAAIAGSNVATVRAAPRFSAIFAAALILASVGPGPAWPEPIGATAQRVITLAPHATEIVFAAGGGDQMVGTVASSDFPEAARALPRIGDGITLNQERLIVLQPTLIIGWRRSGAAVPAEILAGTLGAQMLYSAPTRLKDIPADVRRIGLLLGTEATATETASTMEARIDALEARYAGRQLVTVFVEVGSLPLYTIGGDPLLNDALRACGAVNVYGSTAIPAPRVPIESVLVHDPQLLITAERPGRPTDAVRKRWAGYGLAAAIHGHVHAADPDALFRPGPRFIDATAALCAAIDEVRQAATD